MARFVVVLNLQRHTPAGRVIIPPWSTTILSEAGTTQRDEIFVRSNNTAASAGNVARDMAGGASSKPMYRYKTIIGWRLHARSLSNQKTEAKIACNVLNSDRTLCSPSEDRAGPGLASPSCA
jgi:hypothetical protein